MVGAGCTLNHLLDEGGVSRVDFDVIDVIVDFVVRCVVIVVVGSSSLVVSLSCRFRRCWNRRGGDVA